MLKDIPTLQAQLHPLASDPEQTSPRASAASLQCPALQCLALIQINVSKASGLGGHTSGTITAPLKHTPPSQFLLGWSKTEEDTGERWTTHFHYCNKFLEAVSL